MTREEKEFNARLFQIERTEADKKETATRHAKKLQDLKDTAGMMAYYYRMALTHLKFGDTASSDREFKKAEHHAKLIEKFQ